MIRRILIVDDSPIARRIMKSCIPKDQGYEFFEAENGEEGVRQFSMIRPDVIFLDITMPVMDGLTSLEEIKKIDKEAVVIMCTADIQPKSILKATGLGASTVIRKPPSKESVEDALRKAAEVLGQRRIG
jgi:two-component system, chemotaxis family, chemotaxis protein CheY